MFSITHRFLVALIALFSVSVAGCTEPDSANNAGSVNETSISNDVLNVYASGRLRKPVDEVTDEERAELLNEVQDLYLLADLAREAQLDRKPEVVAQLALQRRSVLAQAAVSDYVDKNPATEEELLTAYEEMKGSQQGEQYKARHILVESEQEARAIIEELKSGDVEFGEIAKEKSIGPSAPQGGDLGWFSTDSMVKPFSDAVIAMEDGSVSADPVKTQFGWHVINREESRKNTPPPYEQVKDQLRPSVEQKKFQQYLDDRRKAANL